MMDYIKTNWVAVLGATTGTISILINGWHWYHERARPKTRSAYLNYAEEDGQPSQDQIRCEIVNYGRRPIIITTLTFLHDNGSQHGRAFGHPEGKTLKEQERIREDFEWDESCIYDYETDSCAIDAWFVDTLGRKHKVKKAKRNLKALWKKVDEKKKPSKT